MSICEINKKSWELAIQTMMIKGKKKVECASKGKLREIYEKTQSGTNYIPQIEELINSYSPPENLKEEEKVFKKFGNRLLSEIRGMSQKDVKQLMQYILWNTAIIENAVEPNDSVDRFRENIMRGISAEGITDNDFIRKLNEMLENNLLTVMRRRENQFPGYKKG